MSRHLHNEAHPTFQEVVRIHDVPNKFAASGLQYILSDLFEDLEWDNSEIPANLDRIVDRGLGLSLICRDLDDAARFVFFATEDPDTDPRYVHISYSEVLTHYEQNTLADMILRRIRQKVDPFSDMEIAGYNVEQIDQDHVQIAGVKVSRDEVEELYDAFRQL